LPPSTLPSSEARRPNSDMATDDHYYSARLPFLSLFWMQLNCILLAVQLLANGKPPDFAL